jgi:hypothetical protein
MNKDKENTMPIPVCPSCLKNEETEPDYRERLSRYLTGLPPEIKTPPEEYRRRLAVCAECAEYENGVCRICGCYTEMRAAKNALACPQKGEGW